MAKKPAKGEDKHPAPSTGKPPTPRLLERYHKEVLPALAEKLGRPNRLSLPRLEKIVINMGVGSAITEKKHLEDATAALAQITGQKAMITQSRVAIAGFREEHKLVSGKTIYIDDLSTLASHRGRGLGGRLLDFIHTLARQQGKDGVYLDSGHQRHDAHRLYLNKGYTITAHHFTNKNL